MKKFSAEERWAMAKEIASKMREEGFGISDIEGMDKFEMSKRFDERVKDMPVSLSMFDGKDYDEDDTFEYFVSCVKFHFNALSNPQMK